MAARVFCAVLLCLSGCLSSTEAAPELNLPVKPGVCLSKLYTEKECAVMRFKWMCDDDSDCPKNERCCSNGCVLQCMAQVTVKPGVCPNKQYTTEECARILYKMKPVECGDDSACPKNEKCCSNGCYRQCVAPVTVKPEVCLSKLYTEKECAVMRFMWMCDHDSDCPKNEKCCHNGCVLQCMAQVTVKPGVCPSEQYTAEECDLIRYVMKPKECGDDSACPKNEKCCSNGCIRQCVAPVTVKPGVCPNKQYTTEECARILYKMKPVECGDDSACPKNEKCCSNGCYRQCVAPVTVKPGVCLNKLYTEKQCAVMRFMWMCDHDSDCPKNERCCSNGCVLQCMAQVTVKPGVCPSEQYTAEECDLIRYVMKPKECGDDSACPKNEKCCSNGCIRQCVAPVTVKPGVCPSRRYTTKECALIKFKQCVKDSDCPKNDKCCHNGCGLQCMAPVTVKPGVCPRRLYTTKECARIKFKPCVNDSDCPKNDKCCHNGCGLQCMAPVKGFTFVESCGHG